MSTTIRIKTFKGEDIENKISEYETIVHYNKD